MDYKDDARKMLNDWKKGNYAFGMNVLSKPGDFAKKAGRSTMLVVTGLGAEKWTEPLIDRATSYLKDKIIDVFVYYTRSQSQCSS